MLSEASDPLRGRLCIGLAWRRNHLPGCAEKVTDDRQPIHHRRINDLQQTHTLSDNDGVCRVGKRCLVKALNIV